MGTEGGPKPSAVDRLKNLLGVSNHESTETAELPEETKTINRGRGGVRGRIAALGFAALSAVGCENGCEYDVQGPRISGSVATEGDDSVDVELFNVQTRVGNREVGLAPGVEINPRLGGRYQNNNTQVDNDQPRDPFGR